MTGPESYLSMSRSAQKRILEEGAAHLALPEYQVEKDIWIAWILQTIFESGLRDQITFKGGTSLSKVYGIIDRFSEDVDLSYDIRRILPKKPTGDEGLPPTISQAGKWSKAIWEKLPGWIDNEVKPLFEGTKGNATGYVGTRLEGKQNEKLVVEYRPHFNTPGYMKPEVCIEFGARSTGEPHELGSVGCVLAPIFPHISFPQAKTRVLMMERTFWEKATAIHVFCQQGELRRDRLFRHWYDLHALAKQGRILGSLSDKSWLEQVVRHKSMFFREKGRDGLEIDLKECQAGNLHLTPDDKMLEMLRAEYENMISLGMFRPAAPGFEEIMAGCVEMELKVNELYSLHP